MRRLTIVFTVLLLVAALAFACGGGASDEPTESTPTAAPTAATADTVTAPVDTTPVPTEFRVAFINLMSPVTVDSTNVVASETYDQRLDFVIEELKAFKPDVVGFNEATITTEHGNTVARLAKELKMEQQMVRANPWFPNASKEQNDEIGKQSGFEEFEVILTRAAFPILKADPFWLNPRTSETEGRAGLHVVVKSPTDTANIDIYITHLTGGGEKVRAAQAASFMDFVKTTRGGGPLLLMGDLSDTPDSDTHKVFTDAGLKDIAGENGAPTCCREALIGMQPALTTRTDYLFQEGWDAPKLELWGASPHKRADGTDLYMSDHDGLAAVFPLSAGTDH